MDSKPRSCPSGLTAYSPPVHLSDEYAERSVQAVFVEFAVGANGTVDGAVSCCCSLNHLFTPLQKVPRQANTPPLLPLVVALPVSFSQN